MDLAILMVSKKKTKWSNKAFDFSGCLSTDIFLYTETMSNLDAHSTCSSPSPIDPCSDIFKTFELDQAEKLIHLTFSGNLIQMIKKICHIFCCKYHLVLNNLQNTHEQTLYISWRPLMATSPDTVETFSKKCISARQIKICSCFKNLFGS